jgi:type I restriction enzyme S subunit
VKLHLRLNPKWRYKPAWSVLRHREELGGDGPLLSLSATFGVRERVEGEGRAASEDTSGYRVVFPGDVVINRLVARDGAISISNLHGQISPAYWVLVPEPGSDARFINYLLNSSPYLAEIGARSKCMPPAQFDLPWEQFRTIPIACPDATLQRAIADYLDAETARIDALIAKKQQMIELLEHRAVALAHTAITGARLAGPKVASRLQWLGDLPVGWALPPLGSQFEVVLGRMLNSERAAGGDLRPYIRNVNVRWDRVDVDDLAEMDFPLNEQSRYRLRVGDLVINEGGAGVGRSAIWRGEVKECYFQKSVLRLRPVGHTVPEWIIECMRVAVAQKVPLVEGNLATIPHLPAEALRVWRLPMPDQATQHAQLEWLGKARQKDIAIQDDLIKQVSLLRERRQALITKAVAGELQIPGMAA